ncbi:ABC transporter ATP-binding protein [Haloplasma contractile]|uniref:Oligopeptide transport ATP-binding protein OppF n=1 Tax=Haloplasma contractile SSD-17B TaxID=1033810 RepID=U2FJZ2_9MOLU|nr:ATP-binding cassette domain-containing protein [Haloplasma contractile]ERJ13135.1 Oligopeptide transport ATP-binding protein OppF [Haloplasma contractile SSD-17B]
MDNTKTPILEVNNLKQHFEVGSGKKKLTVKAVDGVNFSIYEGETFGLVGESGCGKTTTGRSIINLYDITDGEVYLDGVKIAQGAKTFINQIAEVKAESKRKIIELKEQVSSNEITAEEARIQIEEIKEHKRETISHCKHEIKKSKKLNNENKDYYDRIQMIFQDPIASLNPRMTVKEIIAEGLRINGEKDEDVITKKVSDILKVVGLLPEHRFRYPHEFSGGQRQRIGVARALVINPKILIADEPISALDVSIQAQVINLLNDLKEKFGLTVLFIAHDLSVVKYFSDRIAVMYFGKIVEMADADELFENPLHPYTKSLLSAVPLPDPRYERGRKRESYNPAIHQYDEENQPSLVEIKPGHLVSASPKEIEEFKKQLK